MSKRNKIILLLVIIALEVTGIILYMKNGTPPDENMLYRKNFKDVTIKVERYDYSLGQNQIVGVEKSTNKGKDFIKITEEPITISMEPKIVFLNKSLGFIITKSELTESNGFKGIKVTHNGGKTFTDGNINYNDPDIETITVKDVPYKEGKLLKLPCSIYKANSNNTGYVEKDIIFNSTDKGLNWILTESSKYIQFKTEEKYYE